ncbi:MAG: protein-disulfide isomerase [Acidimicrobiaceae bacterium]|nr:protein-disulfide isomerase [Acidimicrobiaceae bacterium]
MRHFDLSYDYRCPFAKNIHLHVITALRGGGDFDVTFVPWTMSQGYKADGAPDVWDDPARDREQLSLAVSTSIRDLQPEYFLDAHEALFRSRHERGLRLVTREEITEALSSTAVDLAAVFDDVDSRRPHKVIGQSFREFEGYDAFGVPTFVVDGDATFVRYMTSPSDDAAASTALLDSLLTLMSTESDLNEFKHTKVPL